MDPATVLNLVTSLGGLLTFVAGLSLARFAGRGWTTGPLAALTAAVTGLVVWAGLHGGWWYAVPNSIPLAGLVLLWDHHLGARHGRPGRLGLLVAAWEIRRGKIRQRRPNGRPMRAIAEVRAEYGQNVLDDATRDPALDRVLSRYERDLAELIRRPDGGLDLLAVTVFANLYLDSLSDPGRHSGSAPPYAGYTHPMLVLAALCRLADRLPPICLVEALDSAKSDQLP